MESPLFSRPVNRSVAAILGAFVVSLLVTVSMPVYLPIGLANGIAVPIILFPATWLLLFLWAIFQPNLWKVWGGYLLVSLIHLLIVFFHFKTV